MCRRNVRILSLCCEWLNVAARGYGTSAAAAAADDDAAIILQSQRVSSLSSPRLTPPVSFLFHIRLDASAQEISTYK